MATILKFEPRPDIGEKLAAGGGGGAAQVVIFPGVRIERHEFSLSDRLDEGPSGKAPARARKTKGGRRE